LEKYYAGDQMKDEMGGACVMYGAEEKCTHMFSGEM
jgi:hypothetical protein